MNKKSNAEISFVLHPLLVTLPTTFITSSQVIKTLESSEKTVTVAADVFVSQAREHPLTPLHSTTRNTLP